MSDSLTIAGVQMDVKLGEINENLQNVEKFLRQASQIGPDLVVFPECSLTGYCFNSLDEAMPTAQKLPGAASDYLAGLCSDLNTHIIVGMLEESNGKVFNCCALIGPEGLIERYRKIHLPYLGVDRFVSPGNVPFNVTGICGTKVGMGICYDVAFPETSRVMMLKGAEIIALPTNWPPPADREAKHTIIVRAMENHVFVLAVNRVGTERGYRFIGQSKLCSPTGEILAQADETNESIIHAVIDPEQAREKHWVITPGENEIDWRADRRPDMYSDIVRAHQHLTPRQRQ